MQWEESAIIDNYKMTINKKKCQDSPNQFSKCVAQNATGLQVHTIPSQITIDAQTVTQTISAPRRAHQ